MSKLLMLIFMILAIMLVTEVEGHYGKQYWRQNKAKNYERQRYDNYRQDYYKHGKYYKGRDQQVVNKKQPMKKAATKGNIKEIAPAKPSKVVKIEKKGKIQQKVEVAKEQKIIMPVAQIPPQIQNQLKQIRRLIEEGKHKVQQEQKNVQKQAQTAVVSVPVPEPICEEKPVYDYNLLVLTWVPEECYENIDCEKDWQTQDDLRSPTIHSFRPYGSSSYYSSCFSDKGDPSCQVNAYKMDFDIDQALWNVTGLIYQISQYWPALKFTHDQDSFYNKQWVHHGSCYLMNMIEDNPNAYKYDRAAFNRTIMVEYFRTAINKFKQLAIDVQPGAQYMQKEDFADDIGFRGKETHFMLECNKKNEIVQITFCFNRSKLPGKQVTIPCTMDDSCDQTKPLRMKKPFMIQT